MVKWESSKMVEEGKRIEIYKVMNGEVVFDVDAEEETIWATQAQIAQIFGVAPQNITYHIKNIYKEGELKEVSTINTASFTHGKTTGAPAYSKDGLVRKRTCKEILQVKTEGKRKIKRKVKVYNLDMIISVGYRVNSKKATQFRIWATSVLRRYLADGVAVNERRLERLKERREVEKLHNVENMMSLVRRLTTYNELDAGEANGVLEVIAKYAGSFKTLKEYDDGYIDLRFLNKKREQRELTIEVCDKAIAELKRKMRGADLFGKERGGMFRGSLTAVFQSFDGKDVYPSISEKAANLLYLIIKDHPFYDGNKRIGALLFILFLTMNDCHLTDAGETKISDRALTAIALLIAESKANEKELIVNLVRKLLE